MTPVTEDRFSHARQVDSWVNHSWSSKLILYFCFIMQEDFLFGGFCGIAGCYQLLVNVSTDGRLCSIEGFHTNIHCTYSCVDMVTKSADDLTCALG